MRFQVPQFIETETKIIGPFTLKQFLFLAGGGAIIMILRYLISSTVLLVIAGLPFAALAAALAFYKIDGIPLPQYILMALSYYTGSKRYQFRKNKEEFPISNSQFPTKT